MTTLQRAAGPSLFVLFFSLPLISSLAFRAFSCECFDDQQLCFLREKIELMLGPRKDHLQRVAGVRIEGASWSAASRAGSRADGTFLF